MSIGIARASQTFNLPDVKPLNCQSCLSFWVAVLIYSIFKWEFIGLSFVAYLMSDLIVIYENK